MKSRILILDSYDGFRQAALQACLELQYEPTIIPAYNADLDLVARIKDISPGDSYPDVIVTRGALATYLTKYFPNSIMSLANPDDVDFFAAIKEALKCGDRIGLIIRDEYEFEKKESIYKSVLGNFYLKSYRYEKAEDITNVLLQAKKDQMDATVGGGTLAFSAAAKIGIPNVFVPTSVFSIKKALQTSLLHVRYKDEERRKNQYSSIVMSHIEYGVLITTDNVIRFANRAMSDILKFDLTTLIGQNIEDVFRADSKSLLDLQDEKVLWIRKQRFLVTKEDSSELENTKTFLFQSASSLQKKEQTIRNSLTDRGYSTRYSFSNLVAESKNMREVVRMAQIYAKTSAPVLITGDSGTGKEVISQSIHHASSRARYPFVAVNCASIPGELFESELYGYEEGAFTGAKRGGKQGLFEIAHGGTLFLDEINSLSLELQGKLLRTIEENEFRRVGSEKTIRSDVRLICASNENLTDLIAKKEFRGDLYYRISTFLLNIDSLNERKEDIIPIARQLLNRYCEKYDISISDFTPEEERFLTQHYYAGNVRELENIVHRFVVQSLCMERGDLLRQCIDTRTGALPSGLKEDGYITIKRGTLANMESEIIDTLLRESNNKFTTAEQLGISRSTLYRKIQGDE